MKLAGQNLGPNEVDVILPRGEDNQIVFKCRAVLDFKEFDSLCPAPKPPVMRTPGKDPEPDLKNKSFVKQMAEYGERRMNWIFLKAVEATDGLVWDTVDMEDPKTWGNYVKEMETVGLSQIEQSRILGGVLEANCLDDRKIEEARKRFLAGRRALVEPSESLPEDEQPSTPSGEPVNA